MPTNLPPQYFKVEQIYREARSIPEKIRALEQMIAIAPKHKGTDHLLGGLRRKISQLKEEEQRSEKKSKRGPSYTVRAEGAGQCVLVGFPNTGKSSLVRALTRARPEVGDYHYTTTAAVPGMMGYEDINIQLVDMPALGHEMSEPWLATMLIKADLLLCLLDLGEEPALELAMVEEELARWHVALYAPGFDEEEVPLEVLYPKPTLVVGMKSDLPEAAENLTVLRAECEERALP